MKELATQTSSVVTVRHGDRKVLYKPKDKAGFKGVFKCGRKYKAQIQIDKVRHYLGLFDTEIEAAKAYDDYALKVLGTKARLNIPTDSAATSTAVIPDEKNKAIMIEETNLMTVGKLGNTRAPTGTSYPTATAAYPHMAHMFPNFPPFHGYPLPMPHGMQFNQSLSMSVSSPRIEELPSTATAATTTGRSSASLKKHTTLENNNSPSAIEPNNTIPHTNSTQDMGIVPIRHHRALHSPDPLMQQYHPYLHMQAYMMAQQHCLMNFPQAAAMGGSSAYPYPYTVGGLPQQQLSGGYYSSAPAYSFPSSSSSSCPSAVSYEQSQPQHQQQFYGQVPQQLLPQQQMYPGMGVYNNLPLPQQLQPATSLQQQQPLPQQHQQSSVEESGIVLDTGQQPQPEADATPAATATASSDGASSTASERTADNAAAQIHLIPSHPSHVQK